jgi:hypothetical protein
MTLQDDEMLCPYCAEVIKKAAIVCKHCNRGLVSQNSDKVATHEEVANITERGKKLEDAVSEYMAGGWVILGQTSNTVQMAERKRFNWTIFIILCCVGIFTAFIPPLVYWIWYFIQKPNIVILSVDKDLKVLRNGIENFGPSNPTKPFVPTAQTMPMHEQTPEEKAKSAASTRKALIIFVVIVVIILVLSCLILSNHNASTTFLPILSNLI